MITSAIAAAIDQLIRISIFSLLPWTRRVLYTRTHQVSDFRVITPLCKLASTPMPAILFLISWRQDLKILNFDGKTLNYKKMRKKPQFLPDAFLTQVKANATYLWQNFRYTWTRYNEANECEPVKGVPKVPQGQSMIISPAKPLWSEISSGHDYYDNGV